MDTPEKQGWHWPIIEGVLCGNMTDRERLGLPDRYMPTRFEDIIPEIYRKLLGKGMHEYMDMIENSRYPLAERLVAGNILAMIGDPRIDPFQPNMIAVKGGDVNIGLDESDVESVMSRFQHIGLDEKWIRKECPRHAVNLKDFRIGKYPVSNQEYRAFLLDTHYPELPTSWAFRRYPQEKSNHPVFTLSSKATEAYTNWLSQKTGRAFRLPSEAEWEYSAAGAEGLEFPWGNDFEPDFANTVETGIFSTTPVGIFVEGNSPFGLADMAGNVEEYVRDVYAAYSGGEFISDHLVQLNGEYRVARGGCFSRLRDLARTRRRHGRNPASQTYAMGFRLAEEV
jgi:formylglycine-generating enzyme required for sulfatase activity